MMRNLFCVTLLVAIATVTSGCANGLWPPRDYNTQWYVLYHQPVALFWSPEEAYAGKRGWLALPFAADRSSSWESFPWVMPDLLGPPERPAVQYGPYKAIRGENIALLLDLTDRPIWAGTWIVPSRVNGKVVSLYLLTAYGGEVAGEAPMCHIGRLDFGNSIHTWEDHVDSYVLVDSGVCPWVFDVDGDGTDELLVIQPQVGSSYANVSQIPWVACLYALRLVHSYIPEEVMKQEALKLSPGYREAIAEARVPLKVAPVWVEAKSVVTPDRGLAIYEHKDGKRTQVATILRNPGNGEWRVVQP